MIFRKNTPSLFPLAMLLLLPSAINAYAKEAENIEQKVKQTIAPSGSQPSTQGSDQFFTGKVRVDPLFSPSDEISASAAYVTFEPSARSAWHAHPLGQRLIVTSGVGLTQEWGKPIVEIKAGDVVLCSAGVKHWHGASPTTAMTHIAVTGTLEGKNVDWMEKVTDEEYKK